jgi:uncharacterized protein (TIGR02246 family)
MQLQATSASTPEDLVQRFAQHVRARDLERLLDLYEPAALFITPSGEAMRGRDAIRTALAGLLSLEPSFEVTPLDVRVADDTALVSNAWILSGRAPDGLDVHQAGRSMIVMRRQSEGHWLMLIDRP